MLFYVELHVVEQTICKRSHVNEILWYNNQHLGGASAIVLQCATAKGSRRT
jgi:hypothetical protein